MLPPVIYLNCHDAGRMVEPYGFPVAAPNLQRFAGEAILFRNAHCAGPTCSPSRAALLTGRYPHQVGMMGLAHRGFGLRDYDEHLARRLKRLGYRTLLSGVQHVAHSADLIGYDEVLSAPWRGLPLHDISNAVNAAQAIEAHGGEPFYLECGFFYPHRPFPPAPASSPACYIPAFLPDSPETRADMNAFREGMRIADQAFGLVLDAVRASGLWDKAIIIITTDHGPAFPFAKCNHNDQGTGVMLMMRIPGVSAPATCDALVSHLDLLPTILQQLGQPAEAHLEGRSLLPLLAGPDAFEGRALVCSTTYHAAYEPTRSLRTARYRYVRRFDSSWQWPILPNIDDGPSKEIICDELFRRQPLEPEALYDLHLDPTCACNRIADPAYACVAADLAARLTGWMKEKDDPLLHGPVPPPGDALIIPPDAYSPLLPENAAPCIRAEAAPPGVME